MSQILIRSLDEKTIHTLKRMAQLHHRSLQGEVKALLVSSAQKSEATLLGSKAQKKWPEKFFDTIFGGWQGESLVRGEQGDYETRDDFK